jgi:hypothetical protein
MAQGFHIYASYNAKETLNQVSTEPYPSCRQEIVECGIPSTILS